MQCRLLIDGRGLLGLIYYLGNHFGGGKRRLIYDAGSKKKTSSRGFEGSGNSQLSIT